MIKLNKLYFKIVFSILIINLRFIFYFIKFIEGNFN